jgi:hypothetical protein
MLADERSREHQFLTQIFLLKVSPAFRACASSFSKARALACARVRETKIWIPQQLSRVFVYLSKIFWREFFMGELLLPELTVLIDFL